MRTWAARFWPHLLAVAFLNVGYHRAQFSPEERQQLYQRFLRDPAGATLADPVAAVRVHHVRDGDEMLYLAWADLMLGRPYDREYLAEESDPTIDLLPVSGASGRLVPYRDFAFQYPPLAVVPILLPALVTTDPMLYPYALAALAGLAALLIVTAGWEMWPTTEYRWMSAAALFLVGVTLETRLDVFAAALVALALLAAVRDRWVLAGALLGAGAALKVYPGFLLPVFVVAANRRWRTIGAFVAAVALSCLPAILGWDGFVQAFQLQSTRGLQVESLGAAALAWQRIVAGAPLEVAARSGARDLVGPASATLALLCRSAVPMMALLAMALCWRTKGLGSRQVFLDGVATAIAGIWIVSPVLSAQFVIWGFPVFLLVSSRPARWLFLCALAANRVEYPALYPFVATLRMPGLIVVTIRDALLLAAFIALLWTWAQRLMSRPSAMVSVRPA
jgi:hypothetical protein